MIIESQFKPAWWLRNAHAQTLWSGFFRRTPTPTNRHERLELPDGDFVDLNFSGGDADTLVCLFHGLQGCIHSPYIRGIMSALAQRGYRSVLMHFRGCSGVPNRLISSYHSGHTDDMAYLFSTLRKRYPAIKLCAIGYSLGANALLKYQGEQGSNSLLDLAIAISPPFLLASGANRMNKGFSSIYQWHLVNLLKKSVAKKMALLDNYPVKQDDVKRVRSFWEFDNVVTAPLHGFSGVDEYYQKSSCRQYLRSIYRATHIIHALDDPLFDEHMIPGALELSSSVTLELSQYGGHIGFIDGNFPGQPGYWLDRQLCHLLDVHYR